MKPMFAVLMARMSEILSEVRRWKPARMVLISRFVYQRRISWEKTFDSSSSHPIYSWEMEWENTLSFANTLILFLAVNKQDVEHKCHGRTANKNRVKVFNSKRKTGTKLPKPCLFNFGVFQFRQHLLTWSSAPQMLAHLPSQRTIPGILTNSLIHVKNGYYSPPSQAGEDGVHLWLQNKIFYERKRRWRQDIHGKRSANVRGRKVINSCFPITLFGW